MNRGEHFEDRLAQVPQRPLPAAWRDQILSAAGAASAPRPVSAPASGSLRGALKALLWPHPAAWGGLAAAWALIFILTLAGRDPAGTQVAGRPPPPSPELRELLRQQEKLLAELTGRPDDVRLAPVHPAAPEPRSQRREDALNA